MSRVYGLQELSRASSASEHVGVGVFALAGLIVVVPPGFAKPQF